jgi:hypothetical protein
MRILTALIFTAALTTMTAAGQKVPAAQLIQMAKAHASGLEQALRDTLTDANIQKGAAAVGEMGEFVFAISSEKPPSLRITAANRRSGSRCREKSRRPLGGSEQTQDGDRV